MCQRIAGTFVFSYLTGIHTLRLRQAPTLMLFRVLFCALLLSGCQAQTVVQKPGWLESLTFYASFDGTMTADHAHGDPVFYTAPNWTALDAAYRVTPDNPDVKLAEGLGRYGDALQFDSNWNPVLFYEAKDNVAYQKENWAGTYSFWLKVVPDLDLRDGYSDPFIITDKNWDNASMYVDFTADDTPRHFRFALFSDMDIWNPERKAWDEIAVEERPMIDIAEHPFSAGTWTHVVLTFERINSAGKDGKMTGYINGNRVGTLSKENLIVSWELPNTLMALGRHYRGLFDELSVYDRALTDNEIKLLYELDLGTLL